MCCQAGNNHPPKLLRVASVARRPVKSTPMNALRILWGHPNKIYANHNRNTFGLDVTMMAKSRYSFATVFTLQYRCTKPCHPLVIRHRLDTLVLSVDLNYLDLIPRTGASAIMTLWDHGDLSSLHKHYPCFLSRYSRLIRSLSCLSPLLANMLRPPFKRVLLPNESCPSS